MFIYLFALSYDNFINNNIWIIWMDNSRQDLNLPILFNWNIIQTDHENIEEFLSCFLC